MSQPPTATLRRSLTPFAQPDSVYSSYIPFRTLTARLIGSAPSFYPIATLSPACINTHVALFSPSFHSPAVDLRLSPVSPSLRRTAFLVSSLTFDCAYCVAHAAAFGDMLRGSLEAQVCYTGMHPQDTLNPDAEHLATEEAATIRLAVAVAKRGPIPAESDLEPLCKHLKELLGSNGLETIKGVIAFTGCLNTLMDTLGVQLEEGAKLFAVQHFQKVDMDFKPGKHDIGTVSQPQSVDTSGVLSTFYGMLDLARAMISAKMFEAKLYQGIPSNGDDLNKWMEDKIGERLSGFFHNIKGVGLKRAVCFGLRENLLARSESRCWSLRERCGLLHLYGWKVGCQPMMDVAMHVSENAERCEVGAIQKLAEGEEENGEWSQAMMIASKLLTGHFDVAERDSVHEIASIMETCPPEKVVELVGFLSWLCYWHRTVVLFGSDEIC